MGNGKRELGPASPIVVNSIKVELRPPTVRGRLHARYVPSARVIVAYSSADIADLAPGGDFINVDGSLVLDVDSELLLVGVEFLARKDVWTVRGPYLPGLPGREADIALSAEAPRQRDTFDAPAGIVTDESRSYALLLLNEEDDAENVEAIELSSTCLALVRDGLLVGFYLHDYPATERSRG
jgi:hypothetical protein